MIVRITKNKTNIFLCNMYLNASAEGTGGTCFNVKTYQHRVDNKASTSYLEQLTYLACLRKVV